MSTLTTTQALERLGIETKIGPVPAAIDGRTDATGFLINTRIGPARRFLEAWILANASDEVPFEYRHDSNRRISQDHMTGAHSSVEALHDALKGNQDMRPFKAALAKFENSGLMAKLKPVIAACERKRRRNFSEYDGEFQYDRRHETEPFQQMVFKRVANKSVTVLADFVCSGGAGNGGIDAYGATVWGIVQILERCQIRVRVVAQNLSDGTGLGGAAGYPTDLRIVIKEAGEYMAPNLLAGCFVNGFYRVLCWGIRNTAIDALGRMGREGMGNGWNKPAIEFKNGILHMSANVTSAYDHVVEAEILKAIRG